jgi:hypothetical protein
LLSLLDNGKNISKGGFMTGDKIETSAKGKLLTLVSALPVIAAIIVFVLTMTKSISVFANGTQ